MISAKLGLIIVIVIAIDFIVNSFLIKRKNTDLKSSILDMLITVCFIIGLILFNAYINEIDDVFDSRISTIVIASILSSSISEVFTGLWDKCFKDKIKLRETGKFVTYIGFFVIILLISPLFGFAAVI